MSSPALSALKRKVASFTRSAREKHMLKLRASALLSRQDFVRLLCLERKRSERSGRHFVLMLVDGDGLFTANGAGSVCERVSGALFSVTRDTDIVGWYLDDAVMGIVFTELGDLSISAVKLLFDRVASGVRRQLSPASADRLKITIHWFPESSGGGPSEPADLTFYPDLTRPAGSKKLAHGVKRVLDVVGSAMALVTLSPLLGVLAGAIRLTSKGPVLFRQIRIGQYGRQFVFLKFRSMYVNSDPSLHRAYVTRFIAGQANATGASGNLVFKITMDPRVTPLGRFLRRTSLDELPQFFNVLKGEMSLVGPRPPLPYEVEKYDVWHRRRVLEARPGITGLWQVNGRSRLTFDDMVRLDLKYIQEASLALDLKILLRTPAAVLNGDGAY